MTAPVAMDTDYGRLVVGTEWATLRSGVAAVGEGTTAVITLEATATPDSTVQVRARSIAAADSTATVEFTGDTAAVRKLETVNVNDTLGDIILLEGRRVAGTGAALSIVNIGALQGSFADEPAGGPETAITVQPQNVSTTVGQLAFFSVSAIGTGTITYLWEKSTNGGVDWSPTSGTFSTYTISNPDLTDDQDQYRVEVSSDNDPVGGPVTSDAATLTVTVNTVFGVAAGGATLTGVSSGEGTAITTVTVDPANQSVTEGSTAVFTAQATGEADLIWAWQENTGTWGDMAGKTGSGGTANLSIGPTVPGDDGRSFRVRFERSSDAGNADTSAAASLTVTVQPSGGAMVTDIEGGA